MRKSFVRLSSCCLAALVVALLVAGASLSAGASNAAAAPTAPDLVSLLSPMDDLWTPSGAGDLHGTVKDATTLAHNDELAVWVNGHATAAQRFQALQDAVYDPSRLVSTGLGSQLGPIYLHGLSSGALPLTSALLSSMQSYVSTGTAKDHYSYPRPYLPATATTTGSACTAATYNASSLTPNRVGKPYADANGNLNITRVPDATDTTGTYGTNPTTISATYASYCSSASFPSGHATSAYLGDLTLATLLPQLAPELLARASEAGNDRIVLGVHYPLDVIGGRMDGESAVASRWADASYRTSILTPARQELVSFLEAQCGHTLATCIANQQPYQDDPYGGATIPGGTSQAVTDRASAVAAFHQRLTYGFAPAGATDRAPSVPSGAADLLRTTFPTLTDAQRTSVLAQTEIASGEPLDVSSGGSWQRLDLASAMSATVALQSDGSVDVQSTDGAAKVVADAPTLTAPGGASVAAGSPIALVGAGFTAGQTYKLVWHDGGANITSVTADGDGGFSASVTVPADTAPGTAGIDVLDAGGTSVLASPLSIAVTGDAHAQSVVTRSPDGNTVATVFVDGSGNLGYTVVQNGETVVQSSSLGLVVGGTDWGTGVTLGTPQTTSHDATYPLLGTHDTGHDDYAGAVIPIERSGASKLSVEVRVFDTGIAVRYDLDSSLAGQTVSKENTSFAFAPSSQITYQPVTASTVDDLQGDTTRTTLSDLGTKQIMVLPTVQLPSGDEYANVTEANVRDWPAIALNTAASGNISTYYWATDNGAGTFNVSANTLHSPFRVLTIAPDLDTLTNSDIVTAVNPAMDATTFPGGDMSWVTPAVSSWASLDASIGQSQSISVIGKLIDDSSAAHVPVVLVEGQMADASWGSTMVQRFAHLKTLVAQGLAEPNPVHIWLWTNYDNGAGSDTTFTNGITYSSGSPYAKNSLQNPDFRDAYLDQVKATGVVGVKVDHIGNETETKVNLYADVDRAAAQRKLMIEFHNPLEPTGLQRTYPNEVGREAIRGAEINYAADQDAFLPFTRYIAGTADYTPLILSNSSKQNNATWAHEVASTVLYTNPYLQISENPANLAPGGIYHPILGDLIAHMPTVWKSSRILPQSQIGSLAGVVRETEDGEYWVAVMATPGAARHLSIPLSFLPAGTTYNADAYSDKQSPSSIARTTTTVTDGTTLTPTVNSGGGYLVRITTKDIDNPSTGSGGSDVYQVASEADLALIAQHPSATFNVTADITMSKPWTPVPMFTGTINGNGHTIDGLTVSGDASKAFIGDNQGTIQQLGFTNATSIVGGAYVQTTRVAVVTVTNDGTLDQVYTNGTDIEGGWRGASLAAENNGSITNSYALNARVVANWEAGAIVGWNSATGFVQDTYVGDADVTTVVNNGGILAGYGYAGTQVTGNVVASGTLSGPSGGNLGRVVGRENGTPTYTDNLSLNTATINGAVVTGGTATNKNGQDTSAADLAKLATYSGIGWNFDTTWKWDAVKQRPTLLAVAEKDADSGQTGPNSYSIANEANLALIALHPDATFTFTADITMTQPWTPVPTFTGTIDGAGHTIDGLTVSGAATKAFIIDNRGTIRQLGFRNATSVVTGAYVQTTRVAIVAVTNDGTIDQVYTRGADVEGGWRGAPIAAENNLTVSNSYSVNTKVVANWESGALVGWSSATGVIQNSYVAGADVTAAVSSGGILTGYGYAGTKLTGDVVYSGKLTVPTSGQLGRVLARENGTPTYTNNLSLSTATINGKAVTGGTATNKNGKDTTAAALQTQATYTGIGWNFSTTWKWDATLQRPTLNAVREVQDAPVVAVPTRTLTYQVGHGVTAAALLTATGATTSTGTLSIDAGGVDFTTAGTYTAPVTADYDGTKSAPIAVTVRVKPLPALTAPDGTTVPAGGDLRVAGVGLDDGAPYAVTLDDGVTPIGQVTTDGGGAFAATVTIPASTDLGSHALHLRTALGVDVLDAPLSITVAVADGGATADGATDVTGTSARLTGRLGAGVTAYQVLYRASDTTTWTATGKRAVAGSDPIGETVSSLAPNTVHYYKVRAYPAGGGLTYSPVVSFRTGGVTPTADDIVVGTPTNATKTGVTINASFNGHGTASTAYVEWGTDAGAYTKTLAMYGAGTTSDRTLTRDLTGLTAGHTYHYRITVIDTEGTASSADRTFTAAAPSPLAVAIGAVDPIGTTTATVNTVVDTGGSPYVSGTVQWGTTTAYGKSLPLLRGAVLVEGGQVFTRPLISMKPGTTYHYKVTVTLEDGDTYESTDQTFTTAPTV